MTGCDTFRDHRNVLLRLHALIQERPPQTAVCDGQTGYLRPAASERRKKDAGSKRIT